MKGIGIQTLRRLRRQFSAEFGDLIDWSRFSIDKVVEAVKARVGAEVYLHAFHWDQNAYSGLALGWTARDGKVFLVLYEQDATDEHRLVIILHELMHILLGHCSTNLAPKELRQVLVQLGLLPEAEQAIMYTRHCRSDDIAHLAIHSDNDEAAAEIGATWIVTRARQIGRLPPAGHAFTSEQVAITALLGNLAAES